MSQTFADEKAVGGDAQRGMVMKAAPVASFVMPQTEFLLELEVVTFDTPAHL